MTVVLSVLMLSLTGCNKYSQIKVVSGKIVSFTMDGMRSADVVLAAEIENPAGKVDVEKVVGTLKHSGKVIGNVSLAPMTLYPKTTAQYRVDAKIELSKDIRLMELLMFTDINKLMECSVDVFGQVKALGIRLKKEYKDIPVKELLED